MISNRKKQEVVDTAIVVGVHLIAVVGVVKIERWLFSRLGIEVVCNCPMGR